jgi:uncharacterized protein (DUF1800 family)
MSISRREFFSAALQPNEPEEQKESTFIDPSNKQLPRHLAKTQSGLSPYTGPWTSTELKHLLRRTLFGIAPSDMTHFAGKTMQQCVDEILTVPTAAPNPPLNTYSYNVNLPDPEVPVGSTWVNASYSGLLDNARRQSLKTWWSGLMIHQDRNILEKMTLFWHNHFATESTVVKDSRFSYKHNALLRANALGNFKSLVKAITIDPAMLKYLNGEDNTKNAPDENYARELQELFTVGKDLANHYTEDDVQEAARVLTGWRTDRTGIASFFDSTRHDTANKTFSSFYNNTVITGKTGVTAGEEELDALLDMIFNQAEVAKYLCRKLYRYFVYYVIDSNVETNVIIPLADHFRTSGYNIASTLALLLKSEHFFDVLNQGCMIKPPMDFVVGSSRLMQLQFPSNANLQQQYVHWLYPQQYAAVLSQDIGDPPNVAGWPAYYQDPQYYELWINSDSLPKRNVWNDLMVYTGYNRQGYKLIYNIIDFVKLLSNPSDPNILINDILNLAYAIDVSQTSKDTMKVAFLLSGQASDHYWTDAWNDYLQDPTNATKLSTVTTRLQGLMKYIFGLAEFQLS